MPLLRPLALSLALASLIAAPHADAATKKKSTGKAPAVAPACSDFYSYANASWLKANPVPQTGATTSLGQLADRALQQQRDLLDASMKAPQNSVQKALGDFWASGLDEAAVEKDGSQPIAPLLSRIDAIKKAKDVPASIAALHQVGIPVAFNFSPDVDLKALDRHIGYFMQGGMGLPDPAFYTRNDADAVTLQGRYRAYVKQILALTGTPAASLDADSASVIQIETLLAKAAKPVADVNNPFNNYAPVPVKDVTKQFRNLQLGEFLKAQAVNDDLVSMSDPGYFKQLDAMVASLKPEQWRAYLRWRVGDSMAPYLSKSFRDAESGFRGRLLRGETLPPPRWQQVLDAINVAAGPMLGHEYVERYLNAETRRQAAVIADQVREAQVAALARTGWGNGQVVEEAKAKLQAMKIEIGAPRRDLDYSVQPMGRGSFGGNMLIASTWRHREEMKRIGKGNADRRWDVLPQQPALAYDLAQNRLIVTAAVLQEEIFDAKQPAAVQYGAFGALVGHELSRGFDVKGRMVDAKGQLRDWWTPADVAAWNALGDKVVAQYNGYAFPVLKNVKVNGALTRDENLADLAGVELAWDAFASAEPQANAAAKQSFYKAWATLWAQNLTDTEAAQRAAVDVHAPGQWRANGPLTQQPSFAQAFACKAGQPMQANEAGQIRIWR